MTYLEKELYDLHHAFPDVPVEALKAGMIAGIEAFAWYKDGVQYVGTCGTKRKDAVAEILNWTPLNVPRGKPADGGSTELHTTEDRVTPK